MRRWLEMQDYWTLQPKNVEKSKEHLFECKDNKSATGHSLLVKLDATHAANPNKNKRFYRSDKMQEAIPTWTNKHISVPVLREHNTKGDVFGRVRTAKYIDQTHLYDLDYPILRDTTFYNTDSTRIPLFDSVDWITENLVGQDGYTGLGYIELGAQITDPEAIRKVFNDEFLSVSVGFKTDAAFCSICHTDWAQEEKCNHKLGSKVNGKDTFLITGNLDYTEVSFVNFPADPFAKVTGIQQFTDSLNKRFYLGLSESQQELINEAAGLTMSDSVISLDSDISVFYEDSMDPKNLTLDSLDEFTPEIKSKDLTASKAFEFKSAIDSLTPESTEDKAKVRSIKSTLNSRIKREKWTNQTDVETAAEMEDALKPVEAIKEKEIVNVNAWDGFNYASEDEKTYFEDSEGVQAEVELELIALGFTDAIEVEEANRTPDMYCGPNKSFLVTDAKTSKACKAVVAKAPISAETKEKISQCIDSREAELGLKTNEVEGIVGLDSNQAFTDAKQGVGEKVLGHYNDLHTSFMGADKEHKHKMRDMHYAVGEVWSAQCVHDRAAGALVTAGHNVNAYGDAIELLDKFYLEATDSEAKNKIAADLKEKISKWDLNGIVLIDSTSHAIITTAELADKEEAINGLTSDVTNEKTRSAAFFKEAKRALATQIVMSKMFAGVDGFKDLDADKLEAKITELSTRNIVSLRDSVKDILTEQKFIPVSTTDVPETTVRADENTQVTDADGNVIDKTIIATDSEKPGEIEDDPATVSRILRYLSPSERTRYFAERRFSK